MATMKGRAHVTSDTAEHVDSFWQRYEHTKAQDVLKNVLLEVCMWHMLAGGRSSPHVDRMNDHVGEDRHAMAVASATGKPSLLRSKISRYIVRHG